MSTCGYNNEKLHHLARKIRRGEPHPGRCSFFVSPTGHRRAPPAGRRPTPLRSRPMTTPSYTINDGRRPPPLVDPRLTAAIEAMIKEHDEALRRRAERTQHHHPDPKKTSPPRRKPPMPPMPIV